MENQKDTERRLLAEASYVYNVDAWEFTHNDVGDLMECAYAACQYDGSILTVGRLKALPHAYAVNVPISYDDGGEPDDWEVLVFETREAATAAYEAALPPSPKSESSQ